MYGRLLKFIQQKYDHNHTTTVDLKVQQTMNAPLLIIEHFVVPTQRVQETMKWAPWGVCVGGGGLWMCVVNIVNSAV